MSHCLVGISFIVYAILEHNFVFLYHIIEFCLSIATKSAAVVLHLRSLGPKIYLTDLLCFAYFRCRHMSALQTRVEQSRLECTTTSTHLHEHTTTNIMLDFDLPLWCTKTAFQLGTSNWFSEQQQQRHRR